MFPRSPVSAYWQQFVRRRKYDFDAITRHVRQNVNRQRKQQNAENIEYPYKLIDPRVAIGDLSGIDDFFLVGQNWLSDQPRKPIALFIGVNDWKYGFLADYLPEYRCAFLPRRRTAIHFRRALTRMSEQPSVIFIWGYTEPRFFEMLMRKCPIPRVRIEDAFVRSAELGASHTTPYSLIFDRSGTLYYDPSRPSDIENLLNYYDFDVSPELLDKADEGLAIIRRLDISKYNPPVSEAKDKFAAFTGRRRVAVIGQVDNDKSLRMGNVDHWSMTEILALAAFENPGCEIIYRPHPEVYRGFQRSKTKAAKISKICTISPPHEGLGQFLDSVDHVYVVTSLAGLDALIRGKKVTVMGAPFYAGWGLTDDRVKLPRRVRTLSLRQLFAATYLLYPRYLGSIDDNWVGLAAACRRIQADRIIQTQKLHKPTDDASSMKDKLFETAHSDFWPTLLFSKRGQVHENFDEAICQAPFYRGLKSPGSLIYQATLLHAVCGALKTDAARQAFLVRVRNFIAPEVYASFLSRLGKAFPGATWTLQWAWLLEELEETSRSFAHIRADIELRSSEASRAAEVAQNTGETPSQLQFQGIEPENKKLLYALIEKCIDHRDFDGALDHVYTLLINGDVQTGLLLPAIRIAALSFDVASAQLLADMLKHANITGHNNAGVNYHVECLSTVPAPDSREKTLEAFALQLVLNPDRVNRTLARLNEVLGRAQGEAISRAILNMDGAQTLRMANAWLELNQPFKAHGIAVDAIEKGDRSDTALVTLSRALASLGNYVQAIKLMERAVGHSPSKENYTELLRLLKAVGRFEDAYRHYQDAANCRTDLPMEGPVLPIYFGLRQIEAGFRCMLDTAMRTLLITYFGEDKYQSSEVLELDDLLLLCDFGPAEEIRYSVFLPEIAARFDYSSFALCCDPRLMPLFARSFPKARFVPVRRTREFSAEFPHAEFNRLPGADLRRVLDNNGIDAVASANKIMLYSEMFWHFRKDYGDFTNIPYLIPDRERAEAYRLRLPRGTRLVGLSWRSQLTNAMRNVHYLSIEELEPLFALDGITFVNLQYDDCVEELAWVESKYPGKIVNVGELDQTNDLDNVASLMSALDLVIGPCTTVIELAGAVGVPGFLFSNHGEMWWREVGQERRDVWYECIRHVRGTLGDKSSIVDALVRELEVWLSCQPLLKS